MWIYILEDDNAIHTGLSSVPKQKKRAVFHYNFHPILI